MIQEDDSSDNEVGNSDQCQGDKQVHLGPSHNNNQQSIRNPAETSWDAEGWNMESQNVTFHWAAYSFFKPCFIEVGL